MSNADPDGYRVNNEVKTSDISHPTLLLFTSYFYLFPTSDICHPTAPITSATKASYLETA